jgi:hypothetical protein
VTSYDLVDALVDVLFPDPKPRKRIIDPDARVRKLARDRYCRSCGRRATNCHHLIGKGQSGDDLAENLIPLCGSGSDGCHGALHGNPWVTADGMRFDAHLVRQQIGGHLWPDEILYCIQRLGSYEAAREYLREQYHVEITGPPLALGLVP